MGYIYKLSGCDARTSMIGSSLLPRNRWGPAVVVLMVFVGPVAAAIFPSMAVLPFILLRLLIPVVLSDVKVTIYLICLKLIKEGSTVKLKC